jgi:hypothetical protein
VLAVYSATSKTGKKSKERLELLRWVRNTCIRFLQPGVPVKKQCEEFAKCWKWWRRSKYMSLTKQDPETWGQLSFRILIESYHKK